MDKIFQLNILTSDKTIYNGKAVSLTAPGEAGYLGILPNHASLLTTLVAGKIVFKDDKGEQKIFDSKSKGFLEVLSNEVTVVLTEGTASSS